MAKDKKAKFDPKKFKEALEFAVKLIEKESAGAEKFMISMHFVKTTDKGKDERRIFHNFSYFDFPTVDWGKAGIALGVEARRAEMVAQTGSTRVE